MKEEYAQSNTPQWGGAELKRASRALRNAVAEPVAHVVQKQVGEQVHRPVLQDRPEQYRRCLHWGRMTEGTTYLVEQTPAVLCAGARVGIGLRGVREAHHELELHPVRQDVERVFERLVDLVVSAHAGHVIRLRLLRAVAIWILLFGLRK